MNTNTIPAPTTTTRTIWTKGNSDKPSATPVEVTRTTWTVGDHALVRHEREDAGEPNWFARNLTNNGPHLFENIDQDGEIAYLIDWSSASDQTSEQALEFAAALSRAARTVLIFNQIRASN